MRRGERRAEIRISWINCRAFRCGAREISKGKRQDHCGRFRPGPAIAGPPLHPAPSKNRDALFQDKKKPEIVRSRAKSTKGGGWRRQPWHVGSGLEVSLATLSGYGFCLGTAPTAFQHPMRCIVSGFFVRCKNFFKRAATGHSTLHFCRNFADACPQSRAQQ